MTFLVSRDHFPNSNSWKVFQVRLPLHYYATIFSGIDSFTSIIATIQSYF